MLYRLRVDLAFEEISHVDEIRQFLTQLFNHAITINPGEPCEEKGYIIAEKCYHDEDPLKPCEVLVHVETS